MSHLRRIALAPGYARRAATAIFTAGVLLALLQVAAASPSHASCGNDGEPVIYCYYEDPNNPDEEAPDLVYKPYRALSLGVQSKVDQVLNIGDCRSLLSPVNPPYQNPAEVWNSVPVNQSPTPYPGDTGGKVRLADAPLGEGTDGEVTIYPAFNSTGPSQIFGLIPEHHGLTRLPTDAEMKALTVLHEIAHLTGALDHDEAGSKLFNLLILKKCFGIDNIPV